MPPTIFISAGEASGEYYGALLIDALKHRLEAAGEQATFFGMGGTRMVAEGLDRVVRAEDMAVMGVTEVVLHLPRIYREFRKLRQSIRDRRPDVAVLIDFPDIHFRLARELHSLGIPVIYFVSPQLWAWKKHRIELVRKYVDRMVVIFPFEEAFYRDRGIRADFVGHPLAETALPTISRAQFAAESGLNPDRTWIGLLPGSRITEIHDHLPEMLKAAHQLSEPSGPAQHPSEVYEYVVPLAPTLNTAQRKQVEHLAQTHAGTLPVRLVNDARAALLHARASVVASGTATVEAALIGNPFVVVYRVSPITYAVAKRVVDVPHVAMVNLIAQKRVVPELIQSDFTASKIVQHLIPLLPDGPSRQSMKQELQGIRNALSARPRRLPVNRQALSSSWHRLCLNSFQTRTLSKVPQIGIPSGTIAQAGKRQRIIISMRIQARPSQFGHSLLRFNLRNLLALVVIPAALVAVATPSYAQRTNARAALSITGYVIDAELDPATHNLSAKTVVYFVPPPNQDVVTFGFHPALKITEITDETGKKLDGERTADGSIRITPAAPFVPGQTIHWNFTYSGVITGNEDGPVEGLKLAAIQEPISYLLYASRWFPITGFMTNRFTAEMKIRVPQGMRVFASGGTGVPQNVTLAGGKPGSQYSFNWSKAGFPGTIVAGRYIDPVAAGPGNVNVYVTISHQQAANQLAQAATKQYDFFTDAFGGLSSHRLNVVEIPNDTLPSVWGPELAGIPSNRIGDKAGLRLLSNTIARQWWGGEVSPRTLSDAWITNGMTRYAELMYVEDDNGAAAMRAAMEDVAAGALAYDTTPLSSAGRLDPFSPQFQSMTLEKGAMIFHMMRWELGDAAFKNALKGALSQFTDKPLSTADFEKVTEAQTQQPMTAFFAQWIDGTGAPQFNNKYTVYRLGNNKGFRTIGEIGQDLDLFNMPVQLQVETDGKTIQQKVDVVGTNSQYVVDTFGRPRRIVIDPQNWVLKTNSDLLVRVAILKGQQLVAQGDLVGALAEYNKALDANPISSLASYRMGEVLFQERNFQAAVNSYRDALRGDGQPPWTEVWSHIAIGKIFDLTGQRDRAVNEYRLAVQTNDNTQGAVNEARVYLQKPYKEGDAQ